MRDPREISDDKFHAIMDDTSLPPRHLVRKAFKANKAEGMATRLHAGQFRKGGDGTTPYITHPRAVAGILSAYGAHEHIVAAGWAHDTLEDGGPGAEAELQHLHPDTQRIVRSLTAPKGQEAKAKYISELHKLPRDALLVKAADRLHNLTDGARTMGSPWIRKYVEETGRLLQQFDKGGLKHPIVDHLRKLHAKLKAEHGE